MNFDVLNVTYIMLEPNYLITILVPYSIKIAS